MNYDDSNRVVALASGGGRQAPPGGPPPQAMQQQPPPPPQQRSPLTSTAEQPARGESVASRRPTIEADFGDAQANPNSIRVHVDGLNVTGQTSRSPHGVVYSPPSDLQSGRHEVRVAGTDMSGRPFASRWDFTSGTSSVNNTITDLRPGNGAGVGDHFMVTGRTMPGARVVVQVGTVDRPTAANVIGQLLGAGGNGSQSVRSAVIADRNGNFQAPIDIQARSGQSLTLVVDSTDARTQAAAPRIVRNLTVEVSNHRTFTLEDSLHHLLRGLRTVGAAGVPSRYARVSRWPKATSR